RRALQTPLDPAEGHQEEADDRRGDGEGGEEHLARGFDRPGEVASDEQAEDGDGQKNCTAAQKVIRSHEKPSAPSTGDRGHGEVMQVPCRRSRLRFRGAAHGACGIFLAASSSRLIASAAARWMSLSTCVAATLRLGSAERSPINPSAVAASRWTPPP